MIREGVWATMAKYKEKATFTLERIHFELDLVYGNSLLKMLEQDRIEYGNQYLDLKLSSLQAAFRRWTWDTICSSVLPICHTFFEKNSFTKVHLKCHPNKWVQWWKSCGGFPHSSIRQHWQKRKMGVVWLYCPICWRPCRIPSIKSMLVILINKPLLKYLRCCFDLQPKHIHKTFNVIFSRKKLSKTSTSLDATRCENRSTICGQHKLQKR